MEIKLQNYMRIKKLLFLAKQTFLDEKGREIIPTLDKLVEFEKEFNITQKLLLKLEGELLDAGL